jgi:hypothetical protein
MGLYHYTVGTALKRIVEAGVLRLTTYAQRIGEAPAVARWGLVDAVD